MRACRGVCAASGKNWLKGPVFKNSSVAGVFGRCTGMYTAGASAAPAARPRSRSSNIGPMACISSCAPPIQACADCSQAYVSTWERRGFVVPGSKLRKHQLEKL